MTKLAQRILLRADRPLTAQELLDAIAVTFAVKLEKDEFVCALQRDPRFVIGVDQKYRFDATGGALVDAVGR